MSIKLEDQKKFKHENDDFDELIQLLIEIKREEGNLDPLEVYFEKIKCQTYRSVSFGDRFKNGYVLLLEGIGDAQL